jgi:DNA-directed RNA polymerase subunit N
MFPIRCYTCNACLAHLHPQYRARVNRPGGAPRAALRELGVERMCCKRMFMGYVDLTDTLLPYPNVDTTLDDAGARMLCEVREERTVVCD